MISQRKLAELLNLTQSAVSAALRDGGTGTSKVAPETRQLVLEAAKKYGYRTNRYASVLRSGKSNLIAVLHGPLSLDWIAKLQALCDEVEACGYTPWTIDMRRFKGGDEGVLDAVLQSKVEGVIAGPYSSRVNIRPYIDHKLPVISFISQFPRGNRNYSYVGPNKIDGFYDVVDHLVKQGCSRITICAGLKQSIPVHPGVSAQATSSQAIMGMEQYYADMKMLYSIPPVVYLERNEDTAHKDEFYLGYLNAKEALKEKPDALIYTNDSRAIGGMAALREAGLRVPEDICVTGFNNELHSVYNWIPMTTVEQPIRPMAKDAVTLLMEMIKDPSNVNHVQHLHPCKLLPRESSRRQAETSPSLSPRPTLNN